MHNKRRGTMQWWMWMTINWWGNVHGKKLVEFYIYIYIFFARLHFLQPNCLRLGSSACSDAIRTPDALFLGTITCTVSSFSAAEGRRFVGPTLEEGGWRAWKLILQKQRTGRGKVCVSTKRGIWLCLDSKGKCLLLHSVLCFIVFKFTV